jgi:predicted SAM-dependent methyltransferase
MDFLNSLKRNPVLRPLKVLVVSLLASPGAIVNLVKRIGTPYRLGKHDKLHLGCGPHLIPGWANIDIGGRHVIAWDLRWPLPIKPRTIRFIYSEHFIEHITREDAVRIFRQCKSLLSDGGVLRLSTPDLRALAEDYCAGIFRKLPHADWNPATPCVMMNEGMREWGHTFVYDRPELHAALKEAGFTNVRDVTWRQSDHPELRDLESRPDCRDLIIEAS